MDFTKMTDADLIEEMSEHIGIKYFHYLLDHPEVSKDEVK